MKQKLPALLALVLVVAPTWYWDLNATMVGPFDEAVYALSSVQLWRTLRLGIGEWCDAMRAALGVRPPAIAWIGQLAVPFGERLGAVPAALLCLTAAAETILLALLYLALVRVQPSRMKGVVATGFVAAGPEFLLLGTRFFVEPLQALAVVWLLLVFAYRTGMSRPMLLAHLVGAVAFGLLVKITTPLFQAPLAAALLLEVLKRGRPRVLRGRARTAHLAAAHVAAALLSAGAAFWYSANLRTAVAYAVGNTVGAWVAQPTAFLPASFSGRLFYWLGQLRSRLVGPGLLVAATLVLAAAVVLRLRGRGAATHELRVLAVLAAASLALILLVCALTRNADARYLLAATPFVAALLLWAMAEVDRGVLTAALAAALALQLVAVVARIEAAREEAIASGRVGQTQDAVDAVLAATCKETGTSETLVGNSSYFLSNDLLAFFAAVDDPGHPRSYRRLSFDARCGARWERKRQEGGVEFFVARALPRSEAQRPADEACAEDLLATVAADAAMEPLAAAGGVLVFRRRSFAATPRRDATRGTGPAGALPFGHIDGPPANAVFTRALLVDGWIVSDKGFDVALEGERGERWEPPCVFARAHVPRPDVRDAYPVVAGSAASGFEAEVDVSGVPEGSYWLSVLGRAGAGRQREIGRVPVEIRHGADRGAIAGARRP